MVRVALGASAKGEHQRERMRVSWDVLYLGVHPAVSNLKKWLGYLS